jgi:hypothetical protein
MRRSLDAGMTSAMCRAEPLALPLTDQTCDMLILPFALKAQSKHLLGAVTTLLNASAEELLRQSQRAPLTIA